MSNSFLIDREIGLAVIQALMTKDNLHRLYVAGRGQYSGCE